MDQFEERLISTGPSHITSMKTTQKTRTSAWDLPSSSNAFFGSSNLSLFSSSLPVLPHEKFNFEDPGSGIQPMNNAFLGSNQLNDNINVKVSADDLNPKGFGIRLPDDEDELLAGIADDFDLNELPSQLEEVEECDLFGNVGGLELDSDTFESVRVARTKITMAEGHMGNGINHYNLQNGVGAIAGEHPFVGSLKLHSPIESATVAMAKTTISDGHMGNGVNHYSPQNGVGTSGGEHPLGEHPSRTLFVRNINSNVEDSELLALFEKYGEIRSLYTACKNRGFVMISYYDIRSAQTAMHALQNKSLRRRKLDIHFSIPKDNPSDKDMNQGTLVIFNLDPSVSNDDIQKIFGVYGEVKEIRETPHKRHHKFIEFYDVRAAEAALHSLNKSAIAGKCIKLEPSRPGGARRNLMQQLTHDLEQDESRIYRHNGGSSMTHSPPGTWLQFGSPRDNGALHVLSKSPTGVAMSPIGGNSLQGLASVLPTMMPNSVKIAPIGKDQNRVNQSAQVFASSDTGNVGGSQHSHSLPDRISGIMTSNVGTLYSLDPLSSNASGVGTLSGPQFLWGSPKPYMERPQSWQLRNMGVSSMSNSPSQGQNILFSSPHGSFLGSSHHSSMHHVGSAPTAAPLERHFGYFPDSPDTSFTNQVRFGNVGVSRNGGGLMMNMTPRSTMNSGFVVSGNMPDNTSPNLRMISSQRLGTFFDNAQFPGIVSMGAEGLVDRNRNRRVEGHGNQVDNKKQYQLDLEKILKGEDTRTTLMIKNIPNKYTSKMLLAAIDENHKGTYDFLYLPIDFKNKCNVGYAFINMVSPSHIISFYEAFDGNKWEKFNSEKVASLAYARIQGRMALVAHFQNSSLMNEDKRCRPIIFNPNGSEIGNQESFQPFSTDLNGDIRRQDRTNLAEGDMAESPQLNNLSQSSKQTSPPDCVL